MIAALLDLQADICPGCGHPQSETLQRTPESDAENARQLAAYWRAHPTEPYFAGAVTCRGCVALARAQRLMADQDEKTEKGGGRVFPESRHWIVYDNPNPTTS